MSEAKQYIPCSCRCGLPVGVFVPMGANKRVSLYIAGMFRTEHSVMCENCGHMFRVRAPRKTWGEFARKRGDKLVELSSV